MMYSISKLDAEKEPIQVQLARAWWRVRSNYSGMTRTTVQLYKYKRMTCATAKLRLKSGLLMSNQIREFWYSYDDDDDDDDDDDGDVIIIIIIIIILIIVIIIIILMLYF